MQEEDEEVEILSLEEAEAELDSKLYTETLIMCESLTKCIKKSSNSVTFISYIFIRDTN